MSMQENKINPLEKDQTRRRKDEGEGEGQGAQLPR